MTIPSQGLSSATSSYRYDSDYQLTQANYPAPAPYNGEVHGWTYDAIGNRLTNTVNGVAQTYTYVKNGSNQLNGQRLSSDSVNAYTYDANGNTITRNGTPGNFTFGWDTDDRMASISGAATASHVYDYQGRRTNKTVSGSTTSYLYDGLNLIQAAGSTTTAYLFGPGIDEPLAKVQAGSVSYYSVDGLGSVHLLTDAVGTTQDAYLYDAWGVIKSQTGTLANDFGYTAREFGEARLWYYRGRYYHAGIGRFGSEDPMRTSQAVEPLYTYASADPVLIRDPMGLFSMGWGCDHCPDVAKALEADTKTWCEQKMATITDPDLRKCIDRSCKNGTILCMPFCGKGELGHSDWFEGQIAVLFGGAARTAKMCTSNWAAMPKEGAGAVVIHEWAHGCGWSHKQKGKGVPGENGEFGD
jgi:RHS repeat-associated protein